MIFFRPHCSLLHQIHLIIAVTLIDDEQFFEIGTSTPSSSEQDISLASPVSLFHVLKLLAVGIFSKLEFFDIFESLLFLLLGQSLTTN